jgi:vacuolar-type H+-ATPase subunit H
MKLRHALLAGLGILFATSAFAQSDTDVLEATRTQIQADRKAVVAKAMGLTDEQGAKFWPVYNEYRESMRKVDDKLVQLANDYFQNTDKMTDQQSQSMLTQWMNLNAEKVNVRKSYVKKFTKAIPTNRVIRFYQVENKMDAVINYELAASIPLSK